MLRSQECDCSSTDTRTVGIHGHNGYTRIQCTSKSVWGSCVAADLAARRSARPWTNSHAMPLCNASLALALASNCPASSWQDVITHAVASPSMLFINAGANKGFGANSFLQRFHSGWTVTSDQWHNFQTEQMQRTKRARNTIKGACGACHQCKDPPPQVVFGKANAKVIAIELMTSNFHLLQSTFRHFQVPGTVVHAAVGDVDGLGDIEPVLVKQGQENLGISIGSADGVDNLTRQVTLLSLDNLTASRGISDVSWLTIDTEGHDKHVLHGAVRLLSSRAVKVLEFEYHNLGAWRHSSVSKEVAWLQGFGYTCFWQSNKGALSPFLPGCDYDFHGWSNVVCAHHRHAVQRLRTLVPVELQ